MPWRKGSAQTNSHAHAHRGWVATFGLLMLVGLATGQGLLVGLGALVILTWLVSWA